MNLGLKDLVTILNAGHSERTEDLDVSVHRSVHLFDAAFAVDQLFELCFVFEVDEVRVFVFEVILGELQLQTQTVDSSVHAFVCPGGPRGADFRSLVCG